MKYAMLSEMLRSFVVLKKAMSLKTFDTTPSYVYEQRLCACVVAELLLFNVLLMLNFIIKKKSFAVH